MDPNATLFRHMSITRKKGLIGLAVLCVTIPVMLVAQAAEKKTLVGMWEVNYLPLFSTLMAISLGNAMEISGKRNPKMGFKSPSEQRCQALSD
jgi:hypothetical protein